MKRLKKAYIFSLYGALGGLVASLLHQYLLLDTLAGTFSPPWRRYYYLAFLGGLVGIAIGFFPIFSQGRGNYSASGAVRAGLVGAFFGGLGGSIALPLVEILHIQLHGGVIGRSIALALLGLAVGFAEKIIGGARPWRGIVGGAVGGGLAGVVLEKFLLDQDTRAGGGIINTHADSAIIALIVMGLSIALFIAVFVNALADAWLEGQPGSKVSGQVYHLSKFREPYSAILGSDKKGGIVFIWIPDAQPRHAEITLLANGARLRNVAVVGETRVNGVPVKERMLQDGDFIEIGHTRLKYRERRKAVLS